MRKMISLAIDASNISSGGGLTHLVQLLRSAKPDKSDIKIIHLWTNTKTANKLPKFDWLVVHTPYWCDTSLLIRMLWQQLWLPTLIKKTACDILFSPGGTLPIRCPVPGVTMSQNMLPFEPDRTALFGRWSWMYLKMSLLRIIQGNSFRRAQGIIFLTQYARDSITKSLVGVQGAIAVISHGIESRFIRPPLPEMPAEIFSGRQFQLLYVSTQMPYKHHLEVIEAVVRLRNQGLSVVLQIVGGGVGIYANTVRSRRLELDSEEIFLKDLGYVNHEHLHDLYRHTDAFIFASSCENLPNILIEAMAASLPIASSNRGPMPEILGDAGVYFDPESVTSIATAIAKLVNDGILRARISQRASQIAKSYSWERCSRETLDFIANLALRIK